MCVSVWVLVIACLCVRAACVRQDAWQQGSNGLTWGVGGVVKGFGGGLLLLLAGKGGGKGGGLCQPPSNYVWRFHAGPLSKIPQYSHTNTQAHANTHPSLMIQSCDCRLPAMIEPLHGPPQHKSMSITSPEHIRHFPFLLVISMAHRHIPIPHQAHSGASAHKQQSRGMKWIQCPRSNTYQHIKSYTLCPAECK